LQESEEDKMERRVWYFKPTDIDEFQEGMAQLRQMCEEMLIGKVEIRIDLIAKAKPLHELATEHNVPFEDS